MMDKDFTHLGSILMYASSEKEINKKIRNYKAETQTLNPNSEVKIEVEPNPNEAEFRDYEATKFFVSVYLKNDEE